MGFVTGLMPPSPPLKRGRLFGHSPQKGEKIYFAISFFAPSGGDAAKRQKGLKSPKRDLLKQGIIKLKNYSNYICLNIIHLKNIL
jgi:hypothetical protein